MIAEKKKFRIESFYFENAGVSIPVEIGYETYGNLNTTRDNAVLVCHYFTGTSHAAGKYQESDPLPGWWDSLIGSGKAIDTDKYFVICSDTLVNINFYNSMVITTGPGTIDPQTGKPYAMSFPITTIQDMVRVQKKLLETFGIERLVAVTGPSMGGLQAFMWGKYFPEMVPRIIAVVATPMVTPFVLVIPNQLGIDAIRCDPKWKNGDYYSGEPPVEGLLNAFKILLMITRTDSWADANYGRKFADPAFKNIPDPRKSFNGKFLVEREVEKTVLDRMKFFDPNAYIYISKANAIYDLAENGETTEEALGSIKARTLMIIDDSDLIFTRRQSEIALKSLPNAEAFYYDSGNGHLSCLNDQRFFEKAFSNFFSTGSVKPLVKKDEG